jgi:tRNA pseudouridine13 synthase
MLFSFKEKIEDFIVQEELSFNCSWTWDFFFVFFEKKNENTMEIINLLCKNLNLQRKELWIAWLKDKDAITRQRLSISKRSLKRCWWEKTFLNLLNEKARVLKTDWHNEPLAIWKNRGNTFTIRLRKKEEISWANKEAIEKKIKEMSLWFPNTFWIQRFWKGNKNYKKALKYFSWEVSFSEDSYEVKFKLQAFWSMWFNEYVMKRWENKDLLVEGDIMVNWRNAFWTEVAVFQSNKLSHFDYWKEKENNIGKEYWEPSHYDWTSDYSEKRFPTGPVLWTEQLLCPNWSKAREYDEELLLSSNFLKHWAKISKKFNLYWFRRPLWITPEKLSWERDNWDLVLSFSLPTWSYASSFLSHILWNIDPKGCLENGLIIPRPSLSS